MPPRTVHLSPSQEITLHPGGEQRTSCGIFSALLLPKESGLLWSVTTIVVMGQHTCLEQEG